MVKNLFVAFIHIFFNLFYVFHRWFWVHRNIFSSVGKGEIQNFHTPKRKHTIICTRWTYVRIWNINPNMYVFRKWSLKIDINKISQMSLNDTYDGHKLSSEMVQDLVASLFFILPLLFSISTFRQIWQSRYFYGM